MALNFPSPSNSLKPKAHKCKPCSIVIIPVLCAAAYLVGIFQRGGSTPTASFLCSSRKRTQSPADGDTLDFSARHSAGDKLRIRRNTVARRDAFPPCGAEFSEYTPCEDVGRSLKFERERLVYRERHCPEKNESTACLVPAPRGYRVPFRWPERREKVWYANVPHKELTVEKAKQNWVKFEIDGDGEIFSFPGGGTMFPRGADSYIDEIGRLIDLRGGSVRTAIDTGCGVASFGAYLLSRNILTMSFAPRDTHEAQVQFALERGVPALIGVMASKRLPYPARAFDMAHCSRCLIPWAQYNGSYLIEVDRILRPGGYWVLSGPPINWERHWRGWERSPDDLKAEQSAIEATARSLCWKKVVQKGELAVWQKPTNHVHCKMTRKLFKQPLFCGGQDPDRAWYTEMEACLTPMPEVSEIRETAGGKLPRWPERLDTVPPRIGIGGLRGLTAESFYENAGLWKRRVWRYKSIDSQLEDGGRYRNFLDMNAYLGGFAAALSDDPVWVMNVVPVEVEVNTLGVIYERGLIGTYQNWCEAMSTYPRTYDFIHADSIFTLYRDRCEMEGILLEMDRILRPGGSVIIRDHVDMIAKIKFIVDGIKWNTRVFDHEDGPHNTEKILFAGKQYWTVSFDPNLIL